MKRAALLTRPDLGEAPSCNRRPSLQPEAPRITTFRPVAAAVAKCLRTGTSCRAPLPSPPAQQPLPPPASGSLERRALILFLSHRLPPYRYLYRRRPQAKVRSARCPVMAVPFGAGPWNDGNLPLGRQFDNGHFRRGEESHGRPPGSGAAAGVEFRSFFQFV